MNKLTVGTKIKYAAALAGALVSFAVILAADCGYLKIANTDFYKSTLAGCGAALKIVSPRYKDYNSLGEPK
jgi:hypothetical protein